MKPANETPAPTFMRLLFPERSLTPNYTLAKKIGSGAFGEVWQGRDTRTNEVVAIKHIQESRNPKRANALTRSEVYNMSNVSSRVPMYLQLPDNADAYEEFEAVGCLPGVVCLRDFFYDPDRRSFYIVMDLVKGQTLDQLMDEWGLGMPLPYEFILYTLWTLLDTLDTLHMESGIIHNDLKLENVILNEADPAHLQLLDLGLACALEEGKENMTCVNQGGTPEYAPPEFWTSHTRYPQSDIWALGLIVWEMATGHSYKVLSPDELPKDLKTFVKRTGTRILQGARPNLSKVKVPMLRVLLNRMLTSHVATRPNAAQTLQWIRDNMLSNEWNMRPTAEITEMLRKRAMDALRAERQRRQIEREQMLEELLELSDIESDENEDMLELLFQATQRDQPTQTKRRRQKKANSGSSRK